MGIPNFGRSGPFLRDLVGLGNNVIVDGSQKQLALLIDLAPDQQVQEIDELDTAVVQHDPYNDDEPPLFI